MIRSRTSWRWAMNIWASRQVKNIAEPVRVYRVRWDDAENQQAEDSASQKGQQVKGQKSKVEGQSGNAWRSWASGGTAPELLLIAAAFVDCSVSFLSPLSPQPSALSHSGRAASALPLPDKPSIVVLPFDNMSGDPEQDYFSDGITEVLTTDLSRISSLFVIARNSAFTYKGKAVKVQEVGKELGVRYVLEGSVQKADDQVRITAQLIDATTGGHCGPSATTVRSKTSLPCKMRSCRRS